jgi:hypothetical protein
MSFEMQEVSSFDQSSSLNFFSNVGRATDALRSLIISQQLLGTREIVVIHHTDCGKIFIRLYLFGLTRICSLHARYGHIQGC